MTEPRTEADALLDVLFGVSGAGMPILSKPDLERRIDAIRAEAAEPYKRVVEAARAYVFRDWRIPRIEQGGLEADLAEALAALPVVVKDEAPGR